MSNCTNTKLSVDSGIKKWYNISNKYTQKSDIVP